MSDEYTVLTDIEYVPEGGGKPNTAKPDDTVSDLQAGSAAWLEANGCVVLKQKADLDSMSRPDLNARALQLGVPEPDKLENKSAVIAAINDAMEASTDA